MGCPPHFAFAALRLQPFGRQIPLAAAHIDATHLISAVALTQKGEHVARINFWSMMRGHAPPTARFAPGDPGCSFAEVWHPRGRIRPGQH
jgi:hypothetical protein